MTTNLPATNDHGGIEPIAAAPKTLMQKGVEKLRQHAELKQMAFDYADFITKTGACPAIYKGKPLDAAAAIIRGTALGFDPDGALESFFVIQGKTGMYGQAMIAVAENVGCRVWEEEATDESVTLCGTKPGDDYVHRVTWTMQRAKTAGYTSNKRYNTNGQQMLRSKCQGELARILAPGALLGLYTEHEQEAFAPVKATATRADRRGGARAALSAAAQQTAQPEPQDAEVTEDSLSLFLAAIRDAGDLDQLGDVSAQVYQAKQENLLTDEEYQQLGEAGTARKAELA